MADIDEFVETLERVVKGGSVVDPALWFSIQRSSREVLHVTTAGNQTRRCELLHKARSRGSSIAAGRRSPTATCDPGATAYRRDQMMQARAAAKVCTKAEITGVAFFDFFHHQTGVAPNEIELHPILAFRCLSP